jgi:F0F1-type ATP synthase membrane subunit b/b'
MKLRVAIATVAGVGLCPSLAFCAENAEAGGGGSWFALSFYVINFAIFIWLMAWLAGPAIKGFFRDRSKGIRDAMAAAAAAYRQAQDVANLAAERIAKLESEKAKIQSDLADETVFQIGRIYDLAQETVTRLKRDSELTAAALKDSAQRRTREAMAEAAGTLAREMIVRNFEASDQDRLIEGFIGRLKEETHA